MSQLTATPDRIWSTKQDDIFLEFNDGSRHLVVRARAGTGKTTTIVEAVRRYLRAHPDKSVVVCAFNKNIAEELVRRFLGYNVTVKTLHAIGLSLVKKYWPDVAVSFTTDRQTDLTQRVTGDTVPDTIKKLISTLHTKGREIAPHAVQVSDLYDIALRFEVEPDAEWSECQRCRRSREQHEATDDHAYHGYDLTYVIQKALEAMDLAAREKPVKTGIDGSDMIFLPVRNGWLRKMFDVGVVDEAQDMTTAQLEIAQGITRERLIVVGDDKQAIYAFRGADATALDRLKAELDALELPLNTTYRCAKSIVREAQRLVPDFEAGPDNPEGQVRWLAEPFLTTEAMAGDFILSRVNAPLVSHAMNLLKQGKRARIAGKDIGKGLVALIRKFKARSVPDLLSKISAWQTREIVRLDAKFPTAKRDSSTYTHRLDAIRDQAEMLSALAQDAVNVATVEQKIVALFTDDGLGDAGVITLSSVHKAKGLEANKVFILADTLRQTTQEEINISYVAITRAKRELVYVVAKRDEDIERRREEEWM